MIKAIKRIIWLVIFLCGSFVLYEIPLNADDIGDNKAKNADAITAYYDSVAGATVSSEVKKIQSKRKKATAKTNESYLYSNERYKRNVRFGNVENGAEGTIAGDSQEVDSNFIMDFSNGIGSFGVEDGIGDAVPGAPCNPDEGSCGGYDNDLMLLITGAEEFYEFDSGVSDAGFMDDDNEQQENSIIDKIETVEEGNGISESSLGPAISPDTRG